MDKHWYIALIQKYIDPASNTYPLYMIHSILVTSKALAIARHMGLSEDSMKFIEEASMLHDNGICRVEDKDLGTTGGAYITHGIVGADILRSEGFPKHAGVAEHHTGVGIYKEQIIERDLPLPHRDLIPETIEERIISYADLFFSKSSSVLWHEETIDEIRASIAKFGQRYSEILEKWILEFGP